jgi:dolichol-phosphate mannosyltransferase
MNKILIMIISDNNLESVNRAILEVENMDTADLLIIDEASQYNIIEELAENKTVKCIVHDINQGYGSSLTEAFNYAGNFDYDFLITANSGSKNFRDNISTIEQNLKYGYDIVTCSRILENYNYPKIDSDTLEILGTIADALNESTGLDITDPLSPDKGYNIRNMENINLTEEGEGALLQIFIQAAHFGYSAFEIPLEDDPLLDLHAFDCDNPLEVFLALIETEKFLFNRGSIN